MTWAGKCQGCGKTVAEHTRLLHCPARERDIERYMHAQVKAHGGEVRRCRWIGRAHAPDDRVMLRRAAWCECKAPGEKPRAGQLREHARMRAHGEVVYVVDSFELVDAMIRELS